ncbi:hypothetical protein JYU23_00740 [bacterium AH-315-C07]|nr:hypothetical protein [bacterium AH-315-C07]
MRSFYTLVLLFAFTSHIWAQSFPASIVKNPIDWGKLEVSMTPEEKLTLVKKLNRIIGIEAALDYYSYTIENIINNFHIMDFNNDGQNDVVYTGFVGGRNNGVILFEIEKGYCRKPIMLLGELLEISRSDVWAPISFKINNYRCCSGFIDFIETYSPQFDHRGNLKYELSAKAGFVHGTFIPPVFYDQVFIRVKNQKSSLAISPINNEKEYDYHLKKTPVVDNFPYKDVYFKHDGNIVAHYDSNATGFAIAEQVDITGQVWWFVMMNADSEPIQSLFCAGGDNNTHPYKVMGWMKKEDLEILKEQTPY